MVSQTRAGSLDICIFYPSEVAYWQNGGSVWQFALSIRDAYRSYSGYLPRANTRRLVWDNQRGSSGVEALRFRVGMNDEDAHRPPVLWISILHAGAVDAARSLVPYPPPNLGPAPRSANPVARHDHVAPSPCLRLGAVQKHQGAANPACVRPEPGGIGAGGVVYAWFGSSISRLTFSP